MVVNNMNSIIYRLKINGYEIANEIIDDELKFIINDISKQLEMITNKNKKSWFKTKQKKLAYVMSYVDHMSEFILELRETDIDNIPEFNKFINEFTRLWVTTTFTVGDKHDKKEFWDGIYKMQTDFMIK